jgi:hypothetical protein
MGGLLTRRPSAPRVLQPKSSLPACPSETSDGSREGDAAAAPALDRRHEEGGGPHRLDNDDVAE